MLRMMRTLLLSASLLVLTGCAGNNVHTYSQRFTLLPDTTGIAKGVPAGALALDTRTGQLCFTTTGDFQTSAPSIPTCLSLHNKSVEDSKNDKGAN
jgi:hypothetical protein